LDLGFPEIQLAEPVSDVDAPEPENGKYVELVQSGTSLLAGQEWRMNGSAVKAFGDCLHQYFYLPRTNQIDGTVLWYGPYGLPARAAAMPERRRTTAG